MSTRQDGAPSPTIGSRDDLVGWIAAGCKPKSKWRIGTEHEKFGFHTDTLGPVPYEGPRGIRALMEELIARFGWEPILEGDNIIALKRPAGEGSETVSLEPGGQFELSGAPLATLHETAAETRTHLSQVAEAGTALGIGFLGVGFSPVWRLDETPRMPKRRYAVMTAARQLYTLATGEVTSKPDALRWGMVTLDRRWWPLLTATLRDRSAFDPFGRPDPAMVDETLAFLEQAARRARDRGL